MEGTVGTEIVVIVDIIIHYHTVCLFRQQIQLSHFYLPRFPECLYESVVNWLARP